jgi:bifunctional DNA-binding transcriptional regulator/antitoxin component of YhaV-PrlF toxin-antitoxin module
MASEFQTVRFAKGGRVVIPGSLRVKFHWGSGVPAVAMATPEGILLRPVTRHAINRLRGILKRQPGGKSFAAEWAEHRREEARLEDRKLRGGRSRR